MSEAEEWSEAATAYQDRVGRMSMSAADRLTSVIHEIHAFNPDSGFVLDNGAGTGALTTTLNFKYPKLRVLAADISPGMPKTIEAKHLPNTETLVIDASELNGPLGTRTFSHVLSTFMIPYSPSPTNALREMHRVLRPGGVIGIGLWGEKNGPVNIWEAACKKLDLTFQPTPVNPLAWLRPEQAEAALSELGFKAVRSEILPMAFEVEDTNAFLHFWFESKNPIALKCINQWEGDLEVVKQSVREVLREDYDDGKNIIVEAILATAIK